MSGKPVHTRSQHGSSSLSHRSSTNKDYNKTTTEQDSNKFVQGREYNISKNDTHTEMSQYEQAELVHFPPSRGSHHKGAN